MTTTFTAEQLNDHLARGGEVLVSTETRATLYKARHAGWFSTGATSGNLYVRAGRGRVRLTADKGRMLLVRIQCIAVIGGSR